MTTSKGMVSAFLSTRRLRNLSPNIITFYSQHLNKFLEFMESHYPDVSAEQIGHKYFLLIVFIPDFLDFIGRGFPDRISVELSFSRLQKGFTPFVVHGGMDSFLATEVCDTFLSTQPFQHYPDLFFCCEFVTGSSLDLPDDGFR